MNTTSERVSVRPILLGLQAIAAVALLISAAIHLNLASTYDPVTSSSLSQGDLFRLQAVASVIAAVMLVVVRRWWAAIPAVLVSAGSLAAVLAYRYVDLGSIGPIPSMYEPVWFGQKSWSAVADAVAVVASLAVLVLAGRARRSGGSVRG